MSRTVYDKETGSEGDHIFHRKVPGISPSYVIQNNLELCGLKINFANQHKVRGAL